MQAGQVTALTSILFLNSGQLFTIGVLEETRIIHNFVTVAVAACVASQLVKAFVLVVLDVCLLDELSVLGLVRRLETIS